MIHYYCLSPLSYSKVLLSCLLFFSFFSPFSFTTDVKNKRKENVGEKKKKRGDGAVSPTVCVCDNCPCASPSFGWPT